AGKFKEARASVEEGLKLKPDGAVNAELRVTAGDIQAAQEQWLDAAKTYESVSIIIDDENVTPRAGEKSVACYRRAGEEEIAKKLLNKLQSRYPEYFQNKRMNYHPTQCGTRRPRRHPSALTAVRTDANQVPALQIRAAHRKQEPSRICRENLCPSSV